MLFYIGPNGILAQCCMVLACQREKAGRVELARSSQIIFSYIMQVLFTGESLNYLSVGGAGLVLISAVLMGIRKLTSTK